LEKYMTIPIALKQLLEMEREVGENVITPDTMIVGIARLGAENREIKYGELKSMLNHNFGSPPHTLILPGNLHFIEKEALLRFKF